MAIDVMTQLDELFAKQEVRSKQYQALLPKSGDLSLVVLKGHLIIEELLFELAAIHCADRAELEKAKLTFAQLLHVVQALVKLPLGADVWQAISLLNAIRNSMVHRLRPAEVDKKLAALADLCKGDESINPPGYKPPTEPAEIAATCVSFIMGSLSVIGPMAEFIEQNLTFPKD
jgi:hypothetical protein